MLSLRIPRLAKRAFAGPLAVALQAGLASLAAPSVVRAEGVADARAPEEVTRSVAAGTPEARLPAARRGGRLATVAMATIPEVSPGTHSVTLWDELARPAPAPHPMPVDAASGSRSASAGSARTNGFVLRPPAGTFLFSYSAP